MVLDQIKQYFGTEKYDDNGRVVVVEPYGLYGGVGAMNTVLIIIAIVLLFNCQGVNNAGFGSWLLAICCAPCYIIWVLAAGKCGSGGKGLKFKF